jgi:hypothetical protein
MTATPNRKREQPKNYSDDVRKQHANTTEKFLTRGFYVRTAKPIMQSKESAQPGKQRGGCGMRCVAFAQRE